MKTRQFLASAGLATAGATAPATTPNVVRAQETFTFKITNAYPPGAPFYTAGPRSPTDLCGGAMLEQG